MEVCDVLGYCFPLDVKKSKGTDKMLRKEMGSW